MRKIESIVGERIREMRIKKKMTQKQIYDETGIKQSELSKIETGKRYPTLHQLAELARVYGTSMDYLAGNTDVRAPYKN